MTELTVMHSKLLDKGKDLHIRGRSYVFQFACWKESINCAAVALIYRT